MFRITDNKGFQITFANGWTVSVQFGRGNYCNNRDFGNYGEEVEPCHNAEIAAWDKNDNWYDFGHDTVDGWKSADEVGEFIEMIRRK